MGRSVAVVWHASFCVVASILYFFFALPRWWELTGYTPHVLGTVLRIVAGVLIGLAALPVVFTQLRTRKPEYRTPQLALTLLVWSTAAHVLAGVVIAGTAISEIWLSLDKAGQWLFGIYGAAAAIALLGIGAFYLSFVAELPPPPPKPLKPKKEKKRLRIGRKGKGAEEASGETAEDVEGEGGEAETAEDAEGEGGEAETAGTETAEAETGQAEAASATSTAEHPQSDTDLVSAAPTAATGDRRKRRPSGKRRGKNGG